MLQRTRMLLPWCLLVTLCGCGESGPELGEVTGKVTLNGRPVPFAFVQFQPVSPPGTYGSAYADKDGNYELQFTSSRRGAPVGRHEVTIRTPRKDEMQVEDKQTGLMVVPDLPAGYVENMEKQFTREVKPGENTLDFELAGAGTP